MEFYTTAAQVIPVFFLAMIFENRTLMRMPDSYDSDADPQDPRHWNMSQVLSAIYWTLLMACGEFAALIGVYRGRSSDLLNAFTWIGLGGGLLSLVLPVLIYQWSLLKRHLVAVKLRKDLVLLVIMVAAWILLTAFVVGVFTR